MAYPQPLKRFVIEPSLVCNIVCSMCYHLHRQATWKDTVKSFDSVKSEIDEGVTRGNNYMDITGGEPTVYPHIEKIVEYALSKGVKTCIISNGLVSEEKARSIINVGVDDWLVSRHGLRDSHRMVTNSNVAYDKQLRFLEQIGPGKRFNSVISKFNQSEIFEMAKEMAVWKPRIINFINMNPHHEWMNKSLETSQVIADLGVVEPLLNQAIDYLESLGIGVNVRYYPMCRIAEKYRRVICNDLHVMFDPYEWDYCTMPKTFERFREWGVETSKCNEEKGTPCNICDLQNICGGANKHWHAASNGVYGEVLIPQRVVEIDKNDFYLYRKYNDLTLIERV